MGRCGISMSHLRFICLPAALFLTCLGGAWGQSGGPPIGYLYPAGGQQGTVLRVVAGGQHLHGAEDVYVSGEGVSGSVVEHVRALDSTEMGQVAGFLRDMVRRRWSVRALDVADGAPPLPDHPWLRDLDHKSPRELARLRARLFDPRRQPNAQIAEQVEIEVIIEPDAPPGDRELRLVTPDGLTTPVRFQVGTLPEVREDDVGATEGADASPVDLPVVINGQIMPGEVDRFSLRARAGQRLVLRMQARRLIPYLADAVPGWFEATMALYDPHGREVAYAGGYRFDPDPVLHYVVPRDGVYGLEVRDSIYRGREDFVYRIAVGELPFVTHMFPLGGRAGERTVASISGWNLPADELELDTTPGGPAIRHAAVSLDLGNDLPYTVDALLEITEAEPNDIREEAREVTPPVMVNGRIGWPGDVDTFAFQGRADEEWVAEVWARRLHSPLDSLVRLLDATGALVASNDDHADPEAGLLAHQADSYLRVRLPQDGTYYVQVLDVQQQGGDEYAYRLHLRPAQPDFALRVTPSSLNLPARGPASLTVHAVRKDGFEGEISVGLTDAPAGFTLNDAHIPAGESSARMTLSVSRDAPYGLFPLRLEGRAWIGGATVSRPATPAEDMMQAFIHRHLVPRQELLAAVTESRRVPAVWRPPVPGIELADPMPLRIPVGGTAALRLNVPETLPDRRGSALREVRFAICAPVRGVTLQDVAPAPGGVVLTLKADANIARLGDAAHLIIEATLPPESRPPARGLRTSLGVLPAVPFEVVRAEP